METGAHVGATRFTERRRSRRHPANGCKLVTSCVCGPKNAWVGWVSGPSVVCQCMLWARCRSIACPKIMQIFKKRIEIFKQRAGCVTWHCVTWQCHAHAGAWFATGARKIQSVLHVALDFSDSESEKSLAVHTRRTSSSIEADATPGGALAVCIISLGSSGFSVLHYLIYLLP